MSSILSGNRNAAPALRLASKNQNGPSQRAGGGDAAGPEDANHKALLRAVREGELGAVKALLAEGADPNAKDVEGWTALMLATVKGSDEVARALLGEGADVDARNDKGWTALRLAVSMDDAEAVRLLLEWGADVNDKDEEGNTALMQAACEKSIESLNLLLAHGADTDIRNHEGETALMLAARHGYPEIVQWLSDADAAGGGVAHDAARDDAGLFSDGELQNLIEKIDGLLPAADGDDEDGDAPEVLAGEASTEVLALEPAAMSAPDVMARLAAALEALRAGERGARRQVSVVDAAHKLMLSLPEAAALSGLSRKHLREAIAAGSLDSRKTGQGWRIKRADLEAYVGKL